PQTGTSVCNRLACIRAAIGERSSRRWQRWLPTRAAAVVSGAFALAVIGGGWWWASSSLAQSPARVAVQPITPLGGGSAVASFADGLTDQLATSLNDSHIPTISRSDSASLK